MRCKVLHLRQANPIHQPSLGAEWVKSRPEERDLGVWGAEKLSRSQ